NPFNEAVTVYFPSDSELNPGRFNSIQTRRLSGGFNYKLPHGWQLQGDHSWGDNSAAYTGWSADTVLRNAALANRSLNVFVDTDAFPIDPSPYRNMRRGDTDSKIMDSSLRGFGPVYTLPGGAVNLAATINRREIFAPFAHLITRVPNRPAGD